MRTTFASSLTNFRKRYQTDPNLTPAVRVVVLSPTRELAIQCQTVFGKLSQFVGMTSALIVGGLDSSNQSKELRESPDFVIATPGRLIEHMMLVKSFSLDSVEVLVLDEADRLLGIFSRNVRNGQQR